MLKEIKANASLNFINFALAIIASYWVTIYHDLEINNNQSYIDLLHNNYIFLGSNIVWLFLAFMSANNIRIVFKINHTYIPELQKIFANLQEGKSVQGVKDSFADLHKYFQIADVAENGEINELIVKPIKINTYIVPVRNISFSLKFSKEKYISYSHEEDNRA